VGGQQKVIDPQPFVTVPAPGLIIPEGVAVRLAMEHPVGVCQPQIQQRAKLRPRFEAAQRIIAKCCGIINIIVGGGTIALHESEHDPIRKEFSAAARALPKLPKCSIAAEAFRST